MILFSIMCVSMHMNGCDAPDLIRNTYEHVSGCVLHAGLPRHAVRGSSVHLQDCEIKPSKILIHCLRRGGGREGLSLASGNARLNARRDNPICHIGLQDRAWRGAQSCMRDCKITFYGGAQPCL